MREGSFNLQKFTTHCRSIQAKIDEKEGNESKGSEEESYTKSTLGNTQQLLPGKQKILDVCWSADKDRFGRNISDITTIAKNTQPMKRNVVSIMGTVSDPLG